MKNLKKLASVGMISVLMLGMVACQGADKKANEAANAKNNAVEEQAEANKAKVEANAKEAEANVKAEEEQAKEEINTQAEEATTNEADTQEQALILRSFQRLLISLNFSF